MRSLPETLKSQCPKYTKNSIRRVLLRICAVGNVVAPRVADKRLEGIGLLRW